MESLGAFALTSTSESLRAGLQGQNSFCFYLRSLPPGVDAIVRNSTIDALDPKPVQHNPSQPLPMAGSTSETVLQDISLSEAVSVGNGKKTKNKNKNRTKKQSTKVSGDLTIGMGQATNIFPNLILF